MLLPAPGNAPTGTIDNAALFFQLAFAGATGAEQDAQQIWPSSAKRLPEIRFFTALPLC
jgi:hypothetical protein